MGGIFSSETKKNDVSVRNGLNQREILEKQREIIDNVHASHAHYLEKMQANKEQLAARQAALARMKGVPNRRMRLRKTASKRKSKTTRSQYAKKTEKKGKGVKNYLGNVISNVTDSVKNTGKAVLSPIGKKTKKVFKKTKKVVKK